MNTNKYTDTQLKQALAKMLPSVILFHPGWKTNLACNASNMRDVLDTELLHLCWLVEESLTLTQRGNHFYSNMHEEWTDWNACHATWQQRTIALAKVKGIEIV